MRLALIVRQFLNRARLVENLQILQDASFRELSVSISTRYLISDYKSIVDAELPVLICLADEDVLLPVRLGRMLETKLHPNRLECLITCQAFVTKSNVDLKSLLSWKPRQSPVLNIVSLPDGSVDISDSVSKEYWHQVAESLSRLESCTNSVLWRIIGVEHNNTPRLILDLENNATSQDSHQKLIHIVDCETGDIIKQIDAMGSREARIEMPVSAAARRYEIMAYPMQHYSLSEIVEIPPSLSPPLETIEIDQDDPNNTTLRNSVRHLWRYIDNLNTADLQARAELLSKYVLPAFPTSTDLAEDLADAYLCTNHPEKAFEVLRKFEPTVLSSEGIMILFQASAAIKANFPYTEILPLLDLKTDAQVQAFVKSAQLLGEKQVMNLLEHLYETDVERLARIVQHVSEDCFTHPTSVLRFTEFLHLCADDGEYSAFKYLEKQCEKNPILMANEKWVDYYVRLGRDSSVSPSLRCLREIIHNSVHNHQVDSTSHLLEFAKDRLSQEAFYYLMEETYGALCSAGDALRAFAAHRALDIIDSLLGTGDLYGASEWYERVVTTFGKKDALLEGRIGQTEERLNSALASTEFGKDYRVHVDDAIYARLKQAMSGKTLIAVGGLRPNYANELKTNLGLRELKWFACELNQRFNPKPVNEALKQPGCCGLLLVTRFMGHSDEESLASASGRVTVAKAHGIGKRAVLLALDEAFGQSAHT
jgi:hypothetical protein